MLNNLYKNNLMKHLLMPMPSNISYFWNFGFLLIFCLILQILSGLFLTMHYSSSIEMAFQSINHIMYNVNMGWLIRSLHANGASLFFFLIYLHIGRGLYYNSLKLKLTWLSGCLILLLLFMIAFMGYVLPWGQMSFWGATVITNLVSALPYVGEMITIWIWGGFSVSKATLMRFYTFHFVLPFILLFMVGLHIFFLHISGSNNPLGISSNLDKISFSPYFLFKDFFSLIFMLFFFVSFVYCFPYNLMDPDNFLPANSLVTPPHIQPEWYFLFAYAILRCIPSKLGGVMALLFSILILMFISFFDNKPKLNFSWKILKKFLFMIWIFNFFMLTILGSMPVEEPYTTVTQLFSIIYFFFFIVYF